MSGLRALLSVRVEHSRDTVVMPTGLSTMLEANGKGSAAQ